MSFCLVKNGCGFDFSSLTLVGLVLVSIFSSPFSPLTLTGDTISALTFDGDFDCGDAFFVFAFSSVLGVFFLVGVLVLTGVFFVVLAGVFLGVSVFFTFSFSFSLPGEGSSCFTAVLVDFRFVGGDLLKKKIIIVGIYF